MSETNSNGTSLIEDAPNETPLAKQREEAEERVRVAYFTIAGIVLKECKNLCDFVKSNNNPLLDGDKIVKTGERLAAAGHHFEECLKELKSLSTIHHPNDQQVYLHGKHLTVAHTTAGVLSSMLKEAHPSRGVDAVQVPRHGLAPILSDASRDLYGISRINGNVAYEERMMLAYAEQRRNQLADAINDGNARTAEAQRLAAMAGLDVKVIADPKLPPNVIVVRNETTGQEVRATVSRSSRSELARQCADRAWRELREKQNAEVREQYAATMVALREANKGGAPMSVRGPLLNRAESLLARMRDPEPLYRWHGDPSCPHCFSLGVRIDGGEGRRPCGCTTGATPGGATSLAQRAFVEREFAEAFAAAVAAGPSVPPGAAKLFDAEKLAELARAVVLLGEQRGEPDP